MNILFITKHDPFSIGGGAFATKAFIKLFSKLPNSKVDLCMAKECANNVNKNEVTINNYLLVKKRNFLRILFEYPRGIFHRYNSIFYKIKKDLDKYDYCVLDNSSVASTFIKYLKRKNIKTFTIHHNYEPDYFDASVKKTIFNKFLRKWIIYNEKISFLNSNYNIFLTAYDLNKFNQEYGNTNAKNIILTPFLNKKKIQIASNDKKNDFIITCSLDNKQNKDSIYNFFNNYFYLFSNFKIIVTGKNPDCNIENYLKHFKNTVLIKNPSNENLQQLLKDTKCYISPIENGGGIKVRCFDAVKLGLPAILHKNAARGYESLVKAGFFYIYEDSSSLKQCINLVISNFNNIDINRYKELSVENFTIESSINKILTLLEI